MNDILRLLITLAGEQSRKKLPTNERYSRLKAESQRLWEEFCSRYDPDTRKTVLHILNVDTELCGIEAEYSFLLGMQMGFAVGMLELVEEGL